jgi:Flp pilus assembly protein TadG
MIRKFFRDRRGVAALEFMIMGPVLVILVFAGFQFGDVIQKQIALQQAVKSGGEYARYFPTAEAGIKSTITNALPPGFTLSSGSPTVACFCNGALLSCTSIGTGTTCTPPLLVNVQATMPASVLNLIIWSATIPNVASYEVRVQ